jgi:hypothetical protein
MVSSLLPSVRQATGQVVQRAPSKWTLLFDYCRVLRKDFPVRLIFD